MSLKSQFAFALALARRRINEPVLTYVMIQLEMGEQRVDVFELRQLDLVLAGCAVQDASGGAELVRRALVAVCPLGETGEFEGAW